MKVVLLNLKNRKYLFGLTIMVGLFLWSFELPKPLFDDPYAMVLLDKDHNLLSASIAEDGQWRLPETDSVPYKFERSILTFEDAYFYQHFGVNPVSLFKALVKNFQEKKVKRGGSTLTMQVVRLAHHNPKRTYLQKALECLQSVRLELDYSKKEILASYANHAPFGGNVVGLRAASWRYFGVEPWMLSWAETATLAVLPNQPGLIYPGANQDVLMKKRNWLLKKLEIEKVITTQQLELALLEPLPQKPYGLPRLAPHLLNEIKKDKKKGRQVVTTIDKGLQEKVMAVLEQRRLKLEANKVYNAATIVIDNKTGEVLSYCGNLTTQSFSHGRSVDVVQAPRSTGSLLKPFLYGLMLNDGLMLPSSLVKDIPVFFKGFRPQNFHRKFEGAVAADEAVARSLNVPAVFMLKDYDVSIFHEKLKKLGMQSLVFGPEHYGLSLILGGAEGTLWEMSGMYASLSRVLNNYWKHVPQRYSKNDIHPPVFEKQGNEKIELQEHSIMDASALWYTFNSMSKVYRPNDDASWELFETSRKVAWKTGTSYGHRDAWAIGTTPEYTVGVWVGNADGEGRPGLTGFNYAAPIMFDVFNLLPATTWWNDFPYDEASEVITCKKSGNIVSQSCKNVDTLFIPLKGIKTKTCSFHKEVMVSEDNKYRVSSLCYPLEKMKKVTQFVLPPVMEWYYQQNHSDYRKMPAFMPGCIKAIKEKGMQMIYPYPNSEIIIPKELGGEKGKSVFELAHRYPEREVFWYLDKALIGTTKGYHAQGVQTPEGVHNLYLVDEEGEELFVRFTVLGE